MQTLHHEDIPSDFVSASDSLYVYVGRTPAGSDWVCYRKPSETREAWEGRSDRMRGRLIGLRLRAKPATVKISKLTGDQAYRIEDEATYVEGLGSLTRSGSTFVEGPRELLEAVADRLDGMDPEYVVNNAKAHTEAETAMAYRAARAHLTSTRARILKALA